MILVAAALASPRTDGDDAASRGAWAEALAAWEACATGADDRDARYCASRADALRPQAADDFAGWSELEAVRRDYRTLGSDAALARVEAALAAHPSSPAAPAMRIWLANEHERRGEAAAAGEMRATIAADPTATERERAHAVATSADDARDVLRRRAAGVGAGFGAIYLLRAAWGPGALRWRSAGLAALLLGGVPTVLAALHTEGVADGFAAAGAVIAAAAALAGRAPVWISIPGLLGGLLAVAWGFGWLPSLGM